MKSLILLMALLISQMLSYAQKQTGFTYNNYTMTTNKHKLLLDDEYSKYTFFDNFGENNETNNAAYEGKFDFQNPNYFSYFFTTTGFGLPKKKFYFHTQYLAVNTLSYGIINNFSLTGGFFLIPNPFGDALLAFILKPHLHFDISKNIHLGAGCLYVKIFQYDYEEGDKTDGYLPYMVITVGNTDANLSFQLITSPSDYDDEDSLHMASSISGMYRLNNKILIVSENILSLQSKDYDYNSYMGTQGFRFIGKKGSFDVGLLIMYDGDPYTSDQTSYAPYVGYSRKF